MLDKAVILARGLGTRMRKADASVRLTNAEAAAADSGLKAMIPIGRPVLDYVLTALADAGFVRACLVLGPEHTQVRDYYAALGSRRIAIDFAVQPEPRGTADAVAAAKGFAEGDEVMVINSDNYYPPEAFGRLRALPGGSGLAAFTREGLLRGNIPPERVRSFAIVQVDRGRLVRIVEKPSDDDLRAMSEPICVSMNCWRLGPEIFEACRSIGPSPRGEWELPLAVDYAMNRMGVAFHCVVVDEPVLDLSHRSDLAGVKSALANVEVNL